MRLWQRSAVQLSTLQVTQIATNPVYKNMLISASRDKSIVVWNLDDSGSVLTGKPVKSLHGHGHFVSDVVSAFATAFLPLPTVSLALPLSL